MESADALCRAHDMTACCQRVVDVYMTLFDPPREGAALYCPDCHARIIRQAGAWVKESLHAIPEQ